MPRLTLVRYWTHHQCTEDEHPLHIIWGYQIRDVSEKLKRILIWFDSNDVTCFSSNFRPAWESLYYVIKTLFNNKTFSENLIHKRQNWTLINNNASTKVLSSYLDFQAYRDHQHHYETDVLKDIATCPTKDLICGVHGRSMKMILESMWLLQQANVVSPYDGKIRNWQVVVIDTEKRLLIATLKPDNSRFIDEE